MIDIKLVEKVKTRAAS